MLWMVREMIEEHHMVSCRSPWENPLDVTWCSRKLDQLIKVGPYIQQKDKMNSEEEEKEERGEKKSSQDYSKQEKLLRC